MIGPVFLLFSVGAVIVLSALMLYGAWQSDRLIHRFEKEGVVFPLMEYASRRTYLWLGWRLLLFNLRRLFTQQDDQQETALMGSGEERELAAFLSLERKPAKAKAWGKLVRAFLIVGVVSLIHVYGLLTAATGVFRFDDNRASNNVNASLGIWGLLVMVGGPIGLGLYLKPNWRGVVSGVLAVVGEAIGFVAGDLILVEFLRSSEYSTFTRDQAMFMAIPSSFGISFLLVSVGLIRTRREIAGLVLGLCVGAIGAILISVSLPLPTEYLTLVWIWINALLFTELLSGKTILPEPGVGFMPKRG
jgi:hypothetical protein